VTEAPLTVGQTVTRARNAAGMTVAQVAEQTRIRGTLISAIEADDFRLCGGDVYARGHLKSIATAVGIDPVAVAALVDRLVHHAEVLVLRGDSYRLKGKGKEVLQGDERG